jgi:hypothetical protein
MSLDTIKHPKNTCRTATHHAARMASRLLVIVIIAIVARIEVLAEEN